MKAIFLSLLFICLPTAATAQLVVLGKGDAAQCYAAAKAGDLGTSSAIRSCTDGLQEPLSRRDKSATHANRGVLHMRAGRTEPAEADFLAALALNPDLYEAHLNHGANLIRQNRLPEARAALETAISGLPDGLLPEAYLNRSIVHDKAGDYTAAWRDLRQALALRPDWPPALDALERYDVVSVPGG